MVTDTHVIYYPEALGKRFRGLWKQCTLAGGDARAAAVWEELARHYSEPHRHYHTLEHLAHCMRQLDLASPLLENPAATEMALWFHDVVIQPGASDNEQKSADLFLQIAGADTAPGFAPKVYDLIRVTMHSDHPEFFDGRYICDIDLSSLGLPWEAFLKDSMNVRAEQAETPDTVFYPAQIRFLSGLLERRAIFFTEFFQTRYEAAARENIRRYIAQLKRSGHE